MYDHVLVPTDGGPGMERAIEEGVALASLCDATVHALYVVDTRDYSSIPEAKWMAVSEELEAEGERAVETVADRARRAGVSVRTTVTRGVPHRTILDYVEAADVDCVVMGTHGRTGVDRFLLGSVTERVTRSSDVPVLVVRISGDVAEGGDGGADPG